MDFAFGFICNFNYHQMWRSCACAQMYVHCIQNLLHFANSLNKRFNLWSRFFKQQNSIDLLLRCSTQIYISLVWKHCAGYGMGNGQETDSFSIFLISIWMVVKQVGQYSSQGLCVSCISLIALENSRTWYQINIRFCALWISAFFSYTVKTWL